VYDLMTVGLKEKMSTEDLRSLKKFRKALKIDDRVIQVKDFGAGSRVFKGSERKVSHIARTAGISLGRSKQLYKAVKYFKPERILELGTSLGLATASMALAAPAAKIDTLEGCPETAGVARSMFNSHQLKNVELHVGEFDSNLPDLLQQNKYDLIFFDGNHQRDATLHYFEMCLKAADENSIFIFDDIHWNQEMEEAWEEIKRHEKVTLTIDSFQWGWVFFRKGREKEHFVLRM
jgi:predicted O-methyltransferase YrrM